MTKAVIHLLSVGLHKYRASPAHDILPHLRQGVSLLNQLAVKDNFFKKYKNQLQHQYVEVIIGVDALFKESRDLDVYCKYTFFVLLEGGDIVHGTVLYRYSPPM